MKVKMILTDLDHTLLRQDGGVSEKTLRTLAKCRAKGIQFAIATARYWIGAERYIELLKPDYEITTDGTLIHSKEKCIYSLAFTEKETNRIVGGLLEAVPEAEITVAEGKRVYWNSKRIAESEKLHKAIYTDYSSELPVRANKIVAGLPDEAVARTIAEKLDCRLQSYRGENWYAFLPKDAGKTAAIKALIMASGVPIEDIAAFGDDTNDIEMLKLCGKGVAVANAVPEVLEIADDVTLSNDDDGVAKWLADHCLCG
ncbi:MAG: HAD family phosphatase [Clostridia bacterium]|nr:HAD family phosphatase [Clostridia bacterium]